MINPSNPKQAVYLVAMVLTAAIASSAPAADWPAYRHDVRRSAVTDEALQLPLAPAWTYVCPQPPRPAWPDPFRLVNRMDFDYAPQPVIAEGIVCFGSSSDDTVRALDAKTGREKWHFITGGPVRFAPQIEQGRVYFASDDGFVYCLDARSGKPLWTFRAAPAEERMIGNHRMISRWPVRTGVLVADGMVYCVAGMWPAEGIFVYALDADTGKALWCNDTTGGSTPQGALLLGGDVLLVPRGNAGPIPLDRHTGKTIAWAKSAFHAGSGGTWLTISGDKIYTFAMHRAEMLMVQPFSLTTGEPAGRAWGTGSVPQLSIEAQLRPFQTHAKEKVSAMVAGDKLYARPAYAVALAGDKLLVGHDGAVVAERTGALSSAELRFAVAGDDLAMFAVVTDRSVVQAPQPWKGSCVEVFGSLPGKPEIGQVLLVPATATAPARALRAQAGKLLEAPEIRLNTTATAIGYELSALIPLSLLTLDKTGDYRLEVQVTVPSADGRVERNTLFGSAMAYQENANFGPFRFQPQAALPSTERIKAALGTVKPSTIKIAGSAELWRTGVRGEARELAVADGRLFVSTSEGVITCFAPADGIEGPPQIHDPAAPLRQAKPPVPTDSQAALLAQIRDAHMDRGFALVVGDAEGRWSEMLAAHTGLAVIHVESDGVRASKLRERLLSDTVLYGNKIHVQHVERLDALPLAQYFANAVIVAGAPSDLSGEELYRVLHPCGGILSFAGMKAEDAETVVQETGALETEIQRSGDEWCIVRGKLPGALDWNSSVKTDERVKWPLRPLWFGGPSTRQVQNFREGARGPVVANGRYFMFSEHALTAVDAYNGAVLWSRPVPKPWPPNTRDVDGLLYIVSDPAAYERADFQRALQVNDDSVYLVLGKAYFQGKGDGLIQLSAHTGEQKKFYGTFNSPEVIPLKSPQTWPLALDANQSGVVGMESTSHGLVLTLATKDPSVTKLDFWELMFDFRPIEARYGLYERGAFHIRVVPAKDENTAASWRPLTGPQHPKFDVSGTPEAAGTKTTVRLPWTQIEKLVGTRPSSFDFAAALNGHSGGRTEPIVRRHLFGNWTADGINNGWARIVLDDATPATEGPTPESIVASAKDAREPATWGPAGPQKSDPSVQEAPTVHPLTGEPVPKIFGIAPVCGGAYCSANVISQSGALYDLADNSGRRFLYGTKTGCTTPQIAALGMFLISEEWGHCVCNYPFRTSLALAPAERRLNEDWAQFYDRDVDTQVRQAYINLGAPGDRRDASGNLWLGSPRSSDPRTPDQYLNPDHPLPYPLGMRDAQSGLWYRRPVRPALWLPLDVESLEGSGPYRFSADRVQIQGTDRPWIYGSGYRGISKATLKLNFFKPLVSTSVQTAMTVDGKLDEASWGSELQSTSAAPPTLPYTGTRVLFRHDRQALYVGVQRPPMIRWTRAPRKGALAEFKGDPSPWQMGGSKADELSPKDNCWRLMVSSDDGRRAAHFAMTPNGTRAEALHDRAQTTPDLTWNPPWQSAVKTDAQSWTLEMAIPWQTLAAAGVQTDRVAVNFLMVDPGLGTEALTYLGLGGHDRCSNFTPLGLDAAPAIQPRRFTVRLHFAEPDDVAAGERVFDVKLQDRIVLSDFDVVREAGGPRTATVKEFRHVLAADALTIEFVSKTSSPIVSGLEVVDEAIRE